MADIEITWGPNQKFLTLLADSGAHVLVIGGTAVRFHAPERREPNDLDLLVEPSEETAQKVLDALAEVLGRRPQVVASQLARPSAGFREKTVLNIDVMTPYVGFNFSEHWERAEAATMAYSSTIVRVASVPALLAWLDYSATAEPSRAISIASDIALLERELARRP